jgi:hypothetical protein
MSKEPQATLGRLKITVESVFVPFSKSRHAKPKNGEKPWPSLNWKVTVKRDGWDVLTTDYSAGVAHCPSHNVKVSPLWKRPDRMWRDALDEFEMEAGFKARGFTTWGGFTADRSKPILPDPLGVIYSLVMDSRVLDAGGFEEWAGDLGYDTDSRSAEATYRACLEIALKMRAAFGDSGMAELQTAFEDY